jgi:hypothetical protein
MFRRLAHLLTYCLLACCALWLPAAQAADAEVTAARIEASDEGYRLAATFSFELGKSVESAIERGIPMYFTTDVELTRPRWYWTDEKAVQTSQTVKIGYNAWTRQFTAAINNSIPQSFRSLDDALGVVKSRRWLIADRSALNSGAVYNVGVRMKLDINQLPAPLQFGALNSSDWHLNTDWKRFTYKADEK